MESVPIPFRDHATRRLRAILLWVVSLSIPLLLWLPVASLYGAAISLLWREPQQWSKAVALDSVARVLLSNTLALAALSCAFALFFGLPIGVALARGPRWFGRIGLMLCVLPLALPPTVLTTAYLQWTQTPPALAQSSLGATTSTTLAPVLIAALVLGLCFYPIVALVVRASLRSMPRQWEEAALQFGSLGPAWRHILGPHLKPAIWGALGIVAALSIWEVGAPDLLGVPTYSMQIRRQLAARDALDASGADMKAALSGWPMFVLGALALWPALRARKYFGGVVQEAPPEFGTQSTLDGRWCVWPSLVIFTLCPLAPIAVFVSQLRPPKVLLETWAANSGEIVNTVISASVATLLSLLLSLLMVSSWRHQSTLRRCGLALGGTLMLVAPVLLGIALIQFYNRPGWEWIYGGGDGSDSLQSLLMDWSSRYSLLIVGYLSRFLPLALWWFDEAANRIDNSLLEAAQNLGAPPARVTRTILLPYLTPVIVGGSALLWSLCAGELATSILVNAPGGQTLPVPIFNWMHIGAIEQVAALSLALFLLNAFALLAAQIMLTAPHAWRHSNTNQHGD